MSGKTPRITIMGEEVDWDALPEPTVAVELGDYFKRVRLSPLAIDEASKIVPQEFWKTVGIYTWLSRRANQVYQQLPASQTKGRLGVRKRSVKAPAQAAARSVTAGCQFQGRSAVMWRAG
jgi:hypothetical protein